MKKIWAVLTTILLSFILVSCKEKLYFEFLEEKIDVLEKTTQKLNYEFKGKEVKFEVEDPEVLEIDNDTIVTKKLGTTKIKGYLTEKETISDEILVNVTNELTLKVNEEFQFNYNLLDNQVLIYEESEIDIIEVNNYTIKGLKPGKLELTWQIWGDEEVYSKVYINVINKSIDDYEKTAEGLATYISENSYDFVIPQNIKYHGSKAYEHLIGKSVGSYLYNYDVEVIRNMIGPINKNHPNKKMDSLEWITVHDTGMSEDYHDAKFISDLTGDENKSNIASWHYSSGNDGIYQQLEDDQVAWHAGDGTHTKFELYKTDIKAGRMFPDVTISKDGFYEIDGNVTKIKAPSIPGVSNPNNSNINKNGIRAVIGDDGYYYLPKTYYNSDYRSIAMFGGNNNSIGIEMAINKGSNVWYTWQLTAKFVAELLVKYDLKLDRVVTHNHFSGKTCPQTMMNSNNMDAFYKMVEVEYNVLKYFKDYKIEFISDSEYVNNQGLIVEVPKTHTTIKYTIKVTDPNNKSFEIEKELPIQIIPNFS